MRNFRISALVTLALGASSAYALPPSTAVYDVNLVATGPQLFQPALQQTFASICQPSTLNLYQATGSLGFHAYSCVLLTTAPVPAALAGRTAILYYRFEGDEVVGIGAMAKNLSVKRLVVNSACSSTTPPAFGNCSVTGYSPSTDGVTSGLTNALVDLGLAGLEPRRHVGENWPSASFLGAQPIGIQLDTISYIPSRGIIYALAVNSSSTITSLTPTQVGGIFNGTYGDWAVVPPFTYPSGEIVVCRGTAGGSLQTATSVHFLDTTCTTSAPFVTPPSGPVWGNAVIANSTQNAMTACIANNAGAIGFLPYTGAPAPTGTRWLQLRTIAPSKAEVIATNYEFWYELTINTDEVISGKPLENALATTLRSVIQSTLPTSYPGQLALSGFGPNPDAASCTYSGDSCGPCL